MSSYVKGLIQRDFESAFADVPDFMVVDIKGIGGNDNNQMRGVLKDKGIRVRVVKNSMMRRAMVSLGRSAASDLFLSGPCTVAYGGDSVVDVAKFMAEWAKKLDAVKIKGAFVDGQSLGVEEAKSLAKMPTRSELQGRIVMLAQSPGAKLAGAILASGGVIAGCIESLIEKWEKDAA
jgi:large subunit ribosomal protein L10